MTPTKRKLLSCGPPSWALPCGQSCSPRASPRAPPAWEAAAACPGRQPSGLARSRGPARFNSEARGRTSREASTKPSTSPSSTLSQARRPRTAIPAPLRPPGRRRRRRRLRAPSARRPRPRRPARPSASRPGPGSAEAAAGPPCPSQPSSRPQAPRRRFVPHAHPHSRGLCL